MWDFEVMSPSNGHSAIFVQLLMGAINRALGLGATNESSSLDSERLEFLGSSRHECVIFVS